jgi:hypothetical protein
MEEYMTLSDKLVSMLVCPNCKEALKYEKENQKLICEKCSLSYRVTNNVPVLLADEAEKI